MKSMIEIIPAIIPDTYLDIEEDTELVKGLVKTVQVDLEDGKFVEACKWPFNGKDVSQFRDLVEQRAGLPYWDRLDYEVDMMVLNPEEIMDDWINAGVKTLIVHRESVDDETLERILEHAQERTVAVALALKPSTDIATLTAYIDRIVFIQCMGSDKLGFHGVTLDTSVLEKIRSIKDRWDVPVSVDIGVNFRTAPLLREAGCTRLVSGSAIFKADSMREAIQTLKGNR